MAVEYFLAERKVKFSDLPVDCRRINLIGIGNVGDPASCSTPMISVVVVEAVYVVFRDFRFLLDVSCIVVCDVCDQGGEVYVVILVK
jgi:hypothetical protein